MSQVWIASIRCLGGGARVFQAQDQGQVLFASIGYSGGVTRGLQVGLTRITDERQESVDELVGGLGEVVEVGLAVVVDHEGAPLLEDEPDGGPDGDAGERADQLLVTVGVGSVPVEADLKTFPSLVKLIASKCDTKV